MPAGGAAGRPVVMFERPPLVPGCPVCLRHAVAFLDSVSRHAWVWFFRCEDCGHAWHTPKDHAAATAVLDA